MKLSHCVFAGYLACTALSAQTAEVTSKDAPVMFKSGINLVPIPVVARDSKGRAVGDLSIDDFQLFDNGKPQMISKFSIERLADDPVVNTPPVAPKPETAAPAAGGGETPVAANTAGIADRFVAYLFDDLHMSVTDLVHTREAARRQIDSPAHARERVAIYTMSGQQMQEFTSDRDKLHKAIEAIGPGHAAMTKMMLDSLCPPITYYMGDRIINKHDGAVVDLVGMDYQMQCENPPPPEPHIPLTTTEIQMVQSAARQAVLAGDKDSETSLDTLRFVVGRLSAMPGQRTIVLVSPGFLVSDDRTDEETTIIDRAVRANVVIGALDARGLYTESGIKEASEGGSTLNSGQKATFATAEAVQQADVMAVVAYGTGGTFFQNSNDFDKGIESTAAAPEYLYILGFSPLDLKMDGKFHTLKVTLKNRKGLELQVRTGYYAPKHATDPAERAKEDIEEAFFSRDEVHDLPATLLTQYFKAANGDVTLSAIAKIDVKALKFRKEAERNRNDITVVAGLFDDDGNYISGAQKIVEMRLQDETLEKRLASGIAVKNNFTVHTGRYVVRLVVRDSEGQTMATQSSMVDIP